MGNELSQEGVPPGRVPAAGLQYVDSDPRLYSTLVYNQGVEGRMMDKPTLDHNEESKIKFGAKVNLKTNISKMEKSEQKIEKSEQILPNRQNHIDTTSVSTDTLCMDEVTWEKGKANVENTSERKVMKYIPTNNVNHSVKIRTPTPVNTTTSAATIGTDPQQIRKTAPSNPQVSAASVRPAQCPLNEGAKPRTNDHSVGNKVHSSLPTLAGEKINRSPGKLTKNTGNQFQDPKKEMFPAPPGFDELTGLDLSHLSAEERMMILQVAARAKQIEQVEQQKIRSIEDQLAHYSESARQNVTKPQPVVRDEKAHIRNSSKEKPRTNTGEKAENKSATIKPNGEVSVNKRRKPPVNDAKKRENNTKGNSSTNVATKQMKPENLEEKKTKQQKCYLCSRSIKLDSLETEKQQNRSLDNGKSSQREGRSSKRHSLDVKQSSNQVEGKSKENTGNTQNDDGTFPAVNCASCNQDVCVNCSVKSFLLAKGVLCALCAKQRELVARSNLWLKETKRNQLYRSQSADTPLNPTQQHPTRENKWDRLRWHRRSYSDSGRKNFVEKHTPTDSLQKDNSEGSMVGRTRRDSWIRSTRKSSLAATIEVPDSISSSNSSQSSITGGNTRDITLKVIRKRATPCRRSTRSPEYSIEEFEREKIGGAAEKEAAGQPPNREEARDVKMPKNPSPSRPSVSAALVKHLSMDDGVKKQREKILNSGSENPYPGGGLMNTDVRKDSHRQEEKQEKMTSKDNMDSHGTRSHRDSSRSQKPGKISYPDPLATKNSRIEEQGRWQEDPRKRGNTEVVVLKNLPGSKDINVESSKVSHQDKNVFQKVEGHDNGHQQDSSNKTPDRVLPIAKSRSASLPPAKADLKKDVTKEEKTFSESSHSIFLKMNKTDVDSKKEKQTKSFDHSGRDIRPVEAKSKDRKTVIHNGRDELGKETKLKSTSNPQDNVREGACFEVVKKDIPFTSDYSVKEEARSVAANASVHPVLNEERSKQRMPSAKPRSSVRNSIGNTTTLAKAERVDTNKHAREATTKPKESNAEKVPAVFSRSKLEEKVHPSPLTVSEKPQVRPRDNKGSSGNDFLKKGGKSSEIPQFGDEEPAVLKEDELDGSDSFFLAVGNSSLATRQDHQKKSAHPSTRSSAGDLHTSYKLDCSNARRNGASDYVTSDGDFIVEEDDTEGDFDHLLNGQSETDIDAGMKRASRCGNLSYGTTSNKVGAEGKPKRDPLQDLSVKVVSQRDPVTTKMVASGDAPNKQKEIKVSTSPTKRSSKKDKNQSKDLVITPSISLSPVQEKTDLLGESKQGKASDIVKIIGINQEVTSSSSSIVASPKIPSTQPRKKSSDKCGVNPVKIEELKTHPNLGIATKMPTDVPMIQDHSHHGGPTKDTKNASPEKKSKPMNEEKKNDVIFPMHPPKSNTTNFGSKPFPRMPLPSTTSTSSHFAKITDSAASESSSMRLAHIEDTQNFDAFEASIQSNIRMLSGEHPDRFSGEHPDRFSCTRYDSDEEELLKSATTSVPVFPETLMGASGYGELRYATDDEDDGEDSYSTGAEIIQRAKPKKLANMFMRRTTSTDSFEELLRKSDRAPRATHRGQLSGKGAIQKRQVDDRRSKPNNNIIPSFHSDTALEYEKDAAGRRSSSLSPEKQNSMDRRYSLPVPVDIPTVRTTFSDPSDLRLQTKSHPIPNNNSRPTISVVTPSLESPSSEQNSGTYKLNDNGNSYHTYSLRSGQGLEKKGMVASLSGELNDFRRESSPSMTSYCSSSSAAGMIANGFARCFSCGTLSTQAISESNSMQVQTQVVSGHGDVTPMKVCERERTRSVDSSTQVSPDDEAFPSDRFASDGLSLADLRRIKSLIEALNDKSDLDGIPTTLREKKSNNNTAERFIIPRSGAGFPRSPERPKPSTIICRDAGTSSTSETQNITPQDRIIYPRGWRSAFSGLPQPQRMFEGSLHPQSDSSSQTEAGIYSGSSGPTPEHYPHSQTITPGLDAYGLGNQSMVSPYQPQRPPYLQGHGVSMNHPYPVSPLPNYPGYGPLSPLPDHRAMIDPARYLSFAQDQSALYQPAISDYGRDISRDPPVYPSYPAANQFGPGRHPLSIPTTQYPGVARSEWSESGRSYYGENEDFYSKPITTQPRGRREDRELYPRENRSLERKSAHELDYEERERNLAERERRLAELQGELVVSRDPSPVEEIPQSRQISALKREEVNEERGIRSSANFRNLETPIHGLRKSSSVPAVFRPRVPVQGSSGLVDEKSRSRRGRDPPEKVIPEETYDFYDTEASGSEDVESHRTRPGRRRYSRSYSIGTDGEDEDYDLYQQEEASSSYNHKRSYRPPSRNRHHQQDAKKRFDYEQRYSSMPRYHDQQLPPARHQSISGRSDYSDYQDGRFSDRDVPSRRHWGCPPADSRPTFPRSYSTSMHDFARGMTHSMSRRSLPQPPEEDEYSWRYESVKRQSKMNPTKTLANTRQRADEHVQMEVSRLQQTMEDLDQEERELDLRLKYLEIGRSRRSSMTSLALHDSLRHAPSPSIEGLQRHGTMSPHHTSRSRSIEPTDSYSNFQHVQNISLDSTDSAASIPESNETIGNRRDFNAISTDNDKQWTTQRPDKRNYEIVDDVGEIESRGFMPPSTTSDEEEVTEQTDSRRHRTDRGRHPNSRSHDHFTSNNTQSHRNMEQFRQHGRSTTSHQDNPRSNHIDTSSRSSRSNTSESTNQHSYGFNNDSASIRRAYHSQNSNGNNTTDSNGAKDYQYPTYYATENYSLPASIRFNNPDTPWWPKPTENMTGKGPGTESYCKQSAEKMNNGYSGNSITQKIISDRYNYKIQKGGITNRQQPKEILHRNNPDRIQNNTRRSTDEYAELGSRHHEAHVEQKAGNSTYVARQSEDVWIRKPENTSSKKINSGENGDGQRTGVPNETSEPCDDDQRTVVSDSEAYHLRKEMTDWFDKPYDDTRRGRQ